MNKLKQFFLNFFETQLLVTLVALPLLIGWGLGLSLMTFIGNLLCAPLLMAMIMLSSLLFFTELFNLPNQTLATLFSLLTHGWDRCLQLGKKEWIVSFAYPGILPLLLIPLSLFFLLRHSYFTTSLKRISGLMILFVTSWCGLWFYEKKVVAWHKPHLHQSLFSVSLVDDTSISFVDHGFFAHKTSVEKAVEFDLKPLLIKHFGNRTIKKLLLNKPGQRSFIGAKTLCTHFKVDTLFLPFFNQHLSKRGWRAFFELKRYLTEHHIVLQRAPLKDSINNQSH